MRYERFFPYPYSHQDLIYNSDITLKSRIYNRSITTTRALLHQLFIYKDEPNGPASILSGERSQASG